MVKPPRPVILTVDRNQRNLELLGQVLAQNGYETRVAGDLPAFAQALAAGGIDLALVDIAGFDRRIWDFCERLRDEGTPFLVLSPRQAAALEEQSVAHGARGMLVKPLAVNELLRLVARLLEEDGQ